MATAYQNLSEYDFNSVPDASEMQMRRRRLAPAEKKPHPGPRAQAARPVIPA